MNNQLFSDIFSCVDITVPSVLPGQLTSRVWGTPEVLNTVPVALFLRQTKAMTTVQTTKPTASPTNTIIHTSVQKSWYKSGCSIYIFHVNNTLVSFMKMFRIYPSHKLYIIIEWTLKLLKLDTLHNIFVKIRFEYRIQFSKIEYL